MLLLVDYSSMLYRAYHSTPSTVPMHGVYGCLNMLTRIVADRRPEGVVLAVDDDWRPVFRTAALPSYKAHRVSDEPDPVGPHEKLGREILSAIGFPVVGADGYEAEDVIATLVERCPGRKDILSGDRDLFALVRDPDVRVLYPLKGTSSLLEVDEAEVTRRYGIPGRRYGDFALLRGDPSDGLPGVPGIGEKTAARLIAEHGSLTGLLSAPNLPPSVHKKLAAAIDYLAAATRVVLPVSDVPLPANIETGLPQRIHDPQRLAALADEHRLGGAVERMRATLNI